MNAQEWDQVLRRFPVLRTLSSREADELRGRAVVRTLAAPTVFLREGESCGAIAFVLEGRIRVSRSAPTGRELTLYHIEPGQTCILTAGCLLAGGSYPAQAVLVEDTTVVLIPSDVFRHLVAASSNMRAFVFEQFGDRLATVMALVEEVAFARMDRRVAALLAHEATRHGDSTVLLTHEEIATQLGTARVVVSRVLENFADRGWVQLARREIRLLQGAALASFGNQSD